MRQAGATLHRGARASHYRGLSCCGAQAPDAQAQQLWLTGPAAPRHMGSSQTRARTRVPCIGRQILNHCATREALLECFEGVKTYISKVYVFLYTFKKTYNKFPLLKNFIYLFIYLFLASLGFRCCARAFSSCGEPPLLFFVVRGLLIAVASCCRAWALGAWASVVVARGLSSCGLPALERRLSSCGS